MSSKQTMRLLALLVVLTLMAGAGVAGAQDGAGIDGVIPCGDTTTCTMSGSVLVLRNAGSGNALFGRADGAGSGVFGRGFRGVFGKTYHSTGAGVRAEASGTGYGVLANSSLGTAIYVPGTGVNGLHVASAGQSGIRVQSAGWDGIEVDSAGWSGIWVQSSGYDAIRVQTAGQDGLRFFEGIGRDYIRAGSDANLEFRVLGTGEVRSDVGFNTPASDFAEMMGVEGNTTSYGPGDVLVVSDAQDRAVELSSAAYSRAVIGVYSTQPGFVGGRRVSDDASGPDIPVAVVGLVPCKVSAENGAIHRGDLLVTSSTPGHAMRADDPPPGTILGKALEALDDGTGVILVLVTLQ